MRLDQLIEAFLSAQAQRLSANTRRAYGYDLGLFRRALPDRQAEDVTVQELRAFLHESASSARSTLARRRAALRALFGWAYQNDLVPADPSGKLERVTVPAREPRPLSPEQVEAILKAIPRERQRDKLLFTLLAETGLRIGEALNLHAPDVHLNEVDGGYLRIVGKGDQERIVPLIDAPRTVRLLRQLLRPQSIGPLFRGDPRKGGHPAEALDYTTVLYHFEQYVSQARAQQPELFADEGQPITIHRLRHTYATEKLRAGVSLPAVRKLLGHKNIQTTLRYAHTDVEDVKRELVEARRRKG